MLSLKAFIVPPWMDRDGAIIAFFHLVALMMTTSSLWREELLRILASIKRRESYLRR
jgi:hypothetical protein